MQRREALAFIGISLSAGLAGCNGGDSDGESPDNGSDGNGGKDGDDGSDGTSNDYTDDAGNEPLAIIEKYYGAFDSEGVDIARINELLHEDVPQALPMHFGGSGIEGVENLEWEIVSEEVNADQYQMDSPPDSSRSLVIEVSGDLVGASQSFTQRFAVATQDGEWMVWDFLQEFEEGEYRGVFHQRPQVALGQALTGVVADSGKIEQLRLEIKPHQVSGPVDISALLLEYIAELPSGEAKNTSNIFAPEEATKDSDPDDVNAKVVEGESGPQDRFGVNVITASNPDNLLMEEGDVYELVVDTYGDDAHPELDGLTPLDTGDYLRLTLFSATEDRSRTEGEVPDLSDAQPGDELDLMVESGD